MKPVASLLLAGAVALLCRDASAQTLDNNGPVGYLNVQGVLHDNGVPVNGFMWFCWDIYASPTGGTSLAHDTNMNMGYVSNGLANVTLSVGDLAALSLSPTQELYLQLDVSPTGVPGSFTVLSPRQRIVPSLFATRAVRAEEARRLIEPLSPDLMPPAISNLTFTGRPVFGASSGAPFAVASSAVVAGLDADLIDGLDSSAFWQLLGNAGTTAGVNFLGTTDNQPLELKVNNTRALRLEPNANAANVIAGSAANSIAGTEGASVLGGHLNAISSALFSVIGGGAENTIDANAETAVVSGGRRNAIQADAKRSTIGGGATNVIQTFTDFATIGGGVNNNILPDTDWATIGGGRTNVIMNGAAESTIGGGGYHLIGNGAESATISGGFSNRVTRDYGVIGGGGMNSIHSSQSAIGGGHQNSIETNSTYSTVGGGDFNRINPDSLGATVGGGVSNVVDQAAVYGLVAGGYSNVVGRPSSVISGGERNFVAGIGSVIAGGLGNQVQLEAKGSAIGGGGGQVVESYVTNGVIAGGFANVLHTNANFSAIGGGRENHIGSSAPYASIPGGREGKAVNYGQVAHASGGFANQEGSAQESFYVVRGITTDTNTAELFLDGASERIRVPTGSTWTYDILVAARSDSPSSAGFHIRGMIGYNSSGNLIQIGTPIIDQFMGGSSITAQVVADNVHKALTVQVRWGLLNASSVRWVATVRTAEVVF